MPSPVPSSRPKPSLLMRIPAALLRKKLNVNKYDFGHVLVLAGSPSMLGAAALTALSAMRTGAGLVTLGIPKSLNSTAQKKISPAIMTFPLNETKNKTLSPKAFSQIKSRLKSFDAIALGPGLSRNTATRKFILQIIANFPTPLVIDADGLFALAGRGDVLLKTKSDKILTPHTGEMARLTGLSKDFIEKNRKRVAVEFSKRYKCLLLLKGHRTVVASPGGKIYMNTSGNPGMAKAGSGDVLTGIIAALLAQGSNAFDATKYGCYLQGRAGDLAAQKKGRASMIATDIIEEIPRAIRLSS